MSEHEICKGCQWNNYPECHGAIYSPTDYMDISDLKETFQCGQKDIATPTYYYDIDNIKSTEEKITELEARVTALENK